MDSLIKKVYYLPMSSLVNENLDFCSPNPPEYEKLNPSRHTHWQWVTNKSNTKWTVLTGMPIVCSPARGSLKSLALDRVMRCFIGQFTNSYEEMGMTPRIPKVRESEFQKKLAFLEPVSEQSGCNFCRLSDSPQEGHAAPLLRGGSLVSVHVCAHTHTNTHSVN